MSAPSPPEPCEVQGRALHPTWFRALSCTLRGAGPTLSRQGRGSLLLSPPLTGGDLGGGGEMIKMIEGGQDGP